MIKSTSCPPLPKGKAIKYIHNPKRNKIKKRSFVIISLLYIPLIYWEV